MTAGSVSRESSAALEGSDLSKSAYRPDIQGLRAVAVGLVVIFHLWPKRLTGGFIGVDVFFVISGFLITSHMYREVTRTGRLSLLGFYARRIRRLLPASFLVLAASLAGVTLVGADVILRQTAREVAAASMYVLNWVLAFNAVDYMAQDSDASPVQHYWSLSVEEQFYLLWPVLMVGVVAVLARRVSRRAMARNLIITVGLVSLLSLVISVVLTYRDQPFSYFVTPTRVWEFGAGALVALVPEPEGRLPRVMASGQTLGVLTIVASALLMSRQTMFPGWIALVPVLGTAAVLLCKPPEGLWGAHRLLGWRPFEFVGDISYSVYLWHWPLIVLAPFLLHRAPHAGEKIAIGGMTLLLAWGTKVWVEDPGRQGRGLSTFTRAMSFMIGGIVLLVVASSLMVRALEARESSGAGDRPSAEAETIQECFGPNALLNTDLCGSPTGNGNWVVPPSEVLRENTEPIHRGCQQGFLETAPLQCEYGVDGGLATIAIVGDSHGTHWFSAFDVLGRDLDTAVVTFTKASCPFTAADRVLEVEQTPDNQIACAAWTENVMDMLVDHATVRDVFVTSRSSAYGFVAPDGHTMGNPRVDGFSALWRRLVEAGKKVHVIKAIPITVGQQVPTCLSLQTDPLDCAITREQGLPPDPMVEAAIGFASDEVEVIDLDDLFCDDDLCYPAVGNVIVYRDGSHLSDAYSRALAPFLADRSKR